MESIEEEQENIKKTFEENLKAKDYFETMQRDWELMPDLFQFLQTFIRDIFYSERFKGSKLLEIGSGATVHNVAIASAYFSSITLSDFVTDNVENLKLWLEEKSEFKQLLSVPAQLEGFENDLETGVRVLESRIRRSVRRVCRCDVLTDQVLLDDASDPETRPPFDVITSFLCLETAPANYSGYCEVLKRISKLLRKGGGLVISGFLQGSPWSVGGKTFHHVKIGQEELLFALDQAGFGNIDLQIQPGGRMENSDFTFGNLYSVAAEKL